MNPFINVVVQPSHGKRKVLISWTVASGYENLKFYVFRSTTNGAPPWKSISNTAVPGTSFEDDAFFVNNRMQQVWYQICGVDENENLHFSNPVGMFDKLSRAEYGGVYKMLSLERKRMNSGVRGNGIEVYHYLPLVEGKKSESYDPDTGQKLIMSCNENDDSYGLPYQGGYGDPIKTWIELYKIGPEIMINETSGHGSDTTYRVQARMLSFPKPMTNHLIVHPTTDNRYVVGEQVQPYLFRGIAAIAYDVQLHLLRRNDPRYRVPIPT